MTSVDNPPPPADGGGGVFQINRPL
jgi:hypothetical protein